MVCNSEVLPSYVSRVCLDLLSSSTVRLLTEIDLSFLSQMTGHSSQMAHHKVVQVASTMRILLNLYMVLTGPALNSLRTFLIHFIFARLGILDPAAIATVNLQLPHLFCHLDTEQGQKVGRDTRGQKKSSTRGRIRKCSITGEKTKQFQSST